MKLRFNRDLVGAIFSLLFSVIILVLMPDQIKVVSSDVINSATFPRLIMMISAFCSSYLIVLEVIKIIRKKPVEMVEIDFRKEARVLVVVALLALFWFMLKYIPFMVAALIFTGLLMFFMGTKKLWKYAVVFTFVIAVTLLFTQALNVSLP